ncbi:helix-turn-helix transcriptional regulator [Bacillus sp. PK3_68]|uniref:helix-turn-helix domain-containing protein n=1 Tax=Bacillus sp. PK3_68 TaxID=2027408 RepID=UPI000E70A534|nr:helix-turn-helix transcriptional regulator [Bacillus sp. PK3_68]RJS60153.1 hypothetical protein CJ483_08815 [Bacillus sp. PK3_68]
MLPERLIKLRKENKKTQQQIADFLGITRPAYTAYERGTRQPDYETLRKIADYYMVSTDYLLGRSDNPDLDGLSDPAFIAFTNDPELQHWYKELPKSPEDRLRKLKKLWEIIKDEE